jgi:hypothetical protein
MAAFAKSWRRCGRSPTVWRCYWHREDAADDDAVLQHVVVVIAPLAGLAGHRDALEDKSGGMGG